jgi:aspartate racemase
MKRKTIGILAGMGPRSTSPFIDLVINECQKQYNAKYDEDFPHIIIYSLPTPFFIDKPIDDNKMKKTLIEGLKKLQSFGVDYIAMPCNTAHAYFDVLKKSIKIPLLNMVDETLKNIKSNKNKITLFATPTTIESKVYQKEMNKLKLNFVFKDDWQKQINTIIKNVKSGNTKKANLLWAKLLNLVEKEKVKTIIIACTELSNLNKPKGFTFIDSSECLAKVTIREYLK